MYLLSRPNCHLSQRSLVSPIITGTLRVPEADVLYLENTASTVFKLVLRHCKDFSCHGHPDRDKGLSPSDGPEEGFSGSALLSDKKRKQKIFHTV